MKHKIICGDCIEKIKQGLLKELENTTNRRKRDGRSEDKEIELVIIHTLDFINDFLVPRYLGEIAIKGKKVFMYEEP